MRLNSEKTEKCQIRFRISNFKSLSLMSLTQNHELTIGKIPIAYIYREAADLFYILTAISMVENSGTNKFFHRLLFGSAIDDYHSAAWTLPQIESIKAPKLYYSILEFPHVTTRQVYFKRTGGLFLHCSNHRFPNIRMYYDQLK